MSHDDDREVFPFPGKVKSSVWEFFGFYKDDCGNLDKSRAICKICRKGTNYSGNTTNLRTHIVHHHKDVAALPEVNYSRSQLSRIASTQSQESIFGSSIYNQVTTSDSYPQTTPPKLQRQVLLDEIFIPPLSADISSNLSRNASQQNTWVLESATGLTDSASVYSKESPIQDNSSGSFADSEADSYISIKETVFETVIHDLIPIEAVDSSRFKRLICMGRRHSMMPTSVDISDLIMRRFLELQGLINNELSKGMHKSLKLEVWRSFDITYLTVSVQALFDNWKMKSYVLTTVELEDNFTLKDIANVLDEKKLSVTFKNIVSSENGIIEKFADENNCVHLVSLCNTIDKVAKLCFEENVGKQLTRKVDKIVKLLTDNQDARSLFSDKQKILQLPAQNLVKCNPKSWTSILTMFEITVEQSNAIISTFNDAGEHLTVEDFTQIQSFIDMLTPLKTALTLTKDMKYPTAAVILPVLKKLEMSLATGENDSQQIIDLKSRMIKTLKQHYESKSRKQFLLLCSLLDPRFKGLKFVSQSDNELAYEILKHDALEIRNSLKVTKSHQAGKVIVKIEAVDDYPDCQGTGFDICSKSLEDADGNADPNQRAKRQKLMCNSPKTGDNAADDWFADVIQEIKDGQPEEDSVSVEINRYKSEMQISSASSPLAWWRDRQTSFPLLSQVAKLYVSVPALLGTENETTERWYQRQRRSIRPNLIEPIVFLHANYEKVKQLRDEF